MSEERNNIYKRAKLGESINITERQIKFKEVKRVNIFQIDKEIEAILEAYEQGVEEVINEDTTIEGVVYGRMARDCRI